MANPAHLETHPVFIMGQSDGLAEFEVMFLAMVHSLGHRSIGHGPWAMGHRPMAQGHGLRLGVQVPPIGLLWLLGVFPNGPDWPYCPIQVQDGQISKQIIYYATQCQSIG